SKFAGKDFYSGWRGGGGAAFAFIFEVFEDRRQLCEQLAGADRLVEREHAIGGLPRPGLAVSLTTIGLGVLPHAMQHALDLSGVGAKPFGDLTDRVPLAVSEFVLDFAGDGRCRGGHACLRPK